MTHLKIGNSIYRLAKDGDYEAGGRNHEHSRKEFDEQIVDATNQIKEGLKVYYEQKKEELSKFSPDNLGRRLDKFIESLPERHSQKQLLPNYRLEIMIVLWDIVRALHSDSDSYYNLPDLLDKITQWLDGLESYKT